MLPWHFLVIRHMSYDRSQTTWQLSHLRERKGGAEMEVDLRWYISAKAAKGDMERQAGRPFSPFSPSRVECLYVLSRRDGEGNTD